MALSTQPYKGARDFYPKDKRIQKYMFATIRRVVESFGYEEYDAPILEPLELYAAKSGQEIVNEQTYTFEDRGGRKVAIRPEMTPTVSRMVAGKRQELAYPVRWYSIPNLWRYERPQRGRLREHWQLNVDIFGVENTSAELEMIQIADAILKNFGADSQMYQFKLNSRKLTNSIVTSYLKLDEGAATDLIKLIDRMAKLEPKVFEAQLKDIVGAKSKLVKELLKVESLEALPSDIKELGSVKELKNLLDDLAALGISNAKFDISLMRGFDYYTDIVFEVFDVNPTNNRSMFGGGRYDGLVGLFGVEPVPTVGFGMGDVTLQNFLEINKLLPDLPTEVDINVIPMEGTLSLASQQVAQALRQYGLKVAIDTSDRKIDKKIKSTDKADIQYALFVGETELQSQKFAFKNLATGESKQLTIEQIARYIEKQ